MKLFTAVIMLLLSFSYGNAENCKPNKINFDICKEAKKIQREAAPNLPQKLSRNMSLVSVMSNGPEVSLTAQLTYTKNFLEKNVKAAGQTMSQIDSKCLVPVILSKSWTLSSFFDFKNLAKAPCGRSIVC